MILVKLYKDGNAMGIPAGWPCEINADGNADPAAFDRAFSDQSELDAYLVPRRAEYDAWERVFYAPKPTVPESIRAAQLRQWLVDAGLYQSVEAMLQNPAHWPDEKTRLKAQIRWDYEPNVRRDDPLVAAMSGMLGLPPAAVDAAFIAAAEIP